MITLSNTTNFRQSLGKAGEAVAADFLVSSGWAVETRNYYVHRRGEIDIIARPPCGKALAFIEVKTRRTSACTQWLDHPGQQSLHWGKQRRIKQAAMAYVSAGTQQNTLDIFPSILRFDLILVDIELNYRDLKELLYLHDIDALRPHCVLTQLADIMGTF